MRSLPERLTDFWRRTRADPRPGVSDEDLAAFKARHHVSLPAELRDIYRAADGTATTDREVFLFWPLAEVGRVTQVVTVFRGIPDFGPLVHTLPNASEYFAFADSMIWSHVYATRFDADRTGPVLHLCGDIVTEVAPSVTAFFERYLDDPSSVVWPPEMTVPVRDEAV